MTNPLLAALLLVSLSSCASAEEGPPPPPPFTAELAEGARGWADAGLEAEDYGTGVALFDAEWLFGTQMMTAVGLGQLILQHPGEREESLPKMEQALHAMLSEEGLAFDKKKYKGVSIEQRLDENKGSAALLGYGGLALATHRAVAPESELVDTEQVWAKAIARRLMTGRLIETYPDEIYPVDNAALIGALALHDQVTGEDHSAAIKAGVDAIKRAIDPKTGLLVQAMRKNGKPLDTPRGSGTFLASWFLLRADPALARALFDAGRQALEGRVLGLYAMREHPAEHADRGGDIDSGPLLMGYSVSATGFAMGAAAGLGEEEIVEDILRTVRLGGPLAVSVVPGLKAPSGGGATGSHLGDAILLAMVTTPGRP
jgi:hypothetical protein